VLLSNSIKVLVLFRQSISALHVLNAGHGITLTATWLLPVALIPAAWDMKPTPNGKVSSPSGVPASFAGGTRNPM
jgi:hypothetical protein